jgi:hypothetical protein
MWPWEAISMSGILSKGMAALFVVVAFAFSAAQSVAAPARQDASKPASGSSLDYEFFKARVEPIFLKNRPGHARCYSCHGSGNGPQYLVRLSPGATSWNEEQSRQIFENVSKLVNRNDPMNSRFLIHPLSPVAGGDIEFVHTGGRQFESKQDPDWQAMAAWASGQKLVSSTRP